MAYLKDFYPFDIDDSYLEYVISEVRYDDNDILLLDVEKLVNTAQRFHYFCSKWRNDRECAVMKVLQN